MKSTFIPKIGCNLFNRINPYNNEENKQFPSPGMFNLCNIGGIHCTGLTSACIGSTGLGSAGLGSAFITFISVKIFVNSIS